MGSGCSALGLGQVQIEHVDPSPGQRAEGRAAGVRHAWSSVSLCEPQLLHMEGGSNPCSLGLL